MSIDFSRVAFIDLEASGLGSNSYPTELGWAIISDKASVESFSCLIRPTSKWTLYSNAWSGASERLTGITRDMLERDGLRPDEVMQRFFQSVGDRELVSDEPDFDAHWLGMLATAAGMSLGNRKIADAKSLITQLGLPHHSGERGGDLLPRHRAEADSRRLAFAVASAASDSR